MHQLKSCSSHKQMYVTEKDHPTLKTLYTQAVELGHKKIIYSRLGETITVNTEDVFNALIKLDQEEFGKKDWAETKRQAREAEGKL